MKLTSLKPFQPISTDTRTIQKDEVFLALIGPNFDGHNFINEAEQKGALAVIVSKPVRCDIPIIQVEDTFQCLLELAAKRRQQVKTLMIAITGSCGKTTTKNMLANICTLAGNTLATSENFNNQIGVALTLLKLMPSHKFAVVEIGTNQIGEIACSANVVKPDLAVIIGAAEVHLAAFGDLAGVAREKGALLTNLLPNGQAILNADDDYFEYWKNLLANQSFPHLLTSFPHLLTSFPRRRESNNFNISMDSRFRGNDKKESGNDIRKLNSTTRKITTFALNHSADIRATEINLHQDGRVSFNLQLLEDEVMINLPLIGQYNVVNALAAAAAAHALGIDLTSIKRGLETVQSEKHRMQKYIGLNGSIIIDDSYSGNPASMQAALQSVAAMPGQKYLIVGDMLELGEKAEKYHRALGLQARELEIDKIFAVGELTKVTVKTFGKHAYHFTNVAELVDAVKTELNTGITILVKGSHGNRLWEVVEKLINLH